MPTCTRYIKHVRREYIHGSVPKEEGRDKVQALVLTLGSSLDQSHSSLPPPSPMEAGEIGGALLFVLAAAAALVVAVSTGAVDFSHPLAGTLLSPFSLAPRAAAHVT